MAVDRVNRERRRDGANESAKSTKRGKKEGYKDLKANRTWKPSFISYWD